MTSPHNGFVSNRVLKLNVGFLLSQSLGTHREVTFNIPDLAVADDLKLKFLNGELRLSRTHEGILVQGTLETVVAGECSRCLTPIDTPVQLTVEELFSHTPDLQDGGEFSIGEDATLDLTPLVREEIIVATPIAPLCQPDCAGLCPQCGKNLNLGPCDCEQDDIDPRLAILLQLRDKE